MAYRTMADAMELAEWEEEHYRVFGDSPDWNDGYREEQMVDPEPCAWCGDETMPATYGRVLCPPCSRRDDVRRILDERDADRQRAWDARWDAMTPEEQDAEIPF